MWYVRLTARTRQGEVSETLRLPSDRLLGLADHTRFNWDRLFRAMETGALKKIEIDYRPTPGVKRIKKINGLFYLEIDRLIVGKGYESRQDAWEQEA